MPAGTRQIEMTWRCSSCGHRNLGRHAACQECGNPKDAGEKYEMPGDTAAAQTVTEPALLRMATAGPNWRCAYCGSDQRRLDNGCAQCGAAPPGPTTSKRREAPARALGWRMRVMVWIRRHPYVAGAAGVVLLIVLAWAWFNRTRNFDATVLAVRWEQRIVVDRYQVWQREGWRQDLAPAAFDVQSLGNQVHHYEDVLDGYNTEYYTEQVACGEDCRDTPERCSESCSDNGNGFATCRTTCSGGGRSCTTRYCPEQRSREVPRYRKEARYAEKLRYRIWDWGYHRTATAAGTATTGLRWPVEDAHVGAGLGPDEQERERREGHYQVTLGYDDDERVDIGVTADAFAAFAVGSQHLLTIKGSAIAADGVPVERIGDD